MSSAVAIKVFANLADSARKEAAEADRSLTERGKSILKRGAPASSPGRAAVIAKAVTDGDGFRGFRQINERTKRISGCVRLHRAFCK